MHAKRIGEVDVALDANALLGKVELTESLLSQPWLLFLLFASHDSRAIGIDRWK